MPTEKGHYGSYGSTFEECVEAVGSWSDDPPAFCNWVHQQSGGGPPGSEERKSEADEGAPGAPFAKFRCAECGNLATVEWSETGPVYGKHGDCPAAGKPLAQLKTDTVVKRGGKWVLLSKKTGEVLGTHETEAEALAQERAVQASKHKNDGRRVVRRIDFYASPNLSPPEQTTEGYVRVDGRISRVGIQVYHDASGNERRELRLPEEVFDPDSVRSFSLVPLTNTHPDVLLTDVTARTHTVGAVGEQIREDGDFLRAPLIIYDRDAISAARAGRSQLSCGYSCELDETPGVWNGQRYDAVQRKIRGNHVALVDFARAGPEARIRLDAADSAVLACAANSNDTRENKMAPALRIDGTTIDLTEGNGPAIQQMIDRAIAAAKKDAADLEVRLANVRKNLEARKRRHDAMKAKIMACDACAGTGKMMDEESGEEIGCDYCDGKGSFRMHEAVGPHGMAKEAGAEDAEYDEDESDELDANELEVEQETEAEAKAAHKDEKGREVHLRLQRAFRKKLDAMVDKRLDRRARLLEVAKRVLGADFKTDGKSGVDIKRAVLAKLDPAAKADKLDARVLEGEFRSAVRRLDAAPSAADVARGATAGAQTAAPRADAQSARIAMMKANQDAWKRPASK